MKITDGKTEQPQHSEEFKVRNCNATEELFLPMRLCICSLCGFLSGIKRSGIRLQTGRKKTEGKEKEEEDVNLSVSEPGGTRLHADALLTFERI